MRLDKWTVGLAAVGAISLSSAVQAEEMDMNVVNAMTSGTTISGYVNTSFRYDFNTAVDGNSADPLGSGKANGFNLDVVNLTVEKPLDESEWAAGYKAELLFGPDAVGYNPSVLGDQNQDVGIKQAYVNVRTPVGNGLELKMGVFDTIIGYEAFNANANPNYTRSYGWSIEPTQHTGLLTSYRISDIVSVAGGIAETVDAGINNRPTNPAVGKKAWDVSYMGAVAVTAPEDMGALAGSTLYGGIVYGANTAAGDNSANYYTGVTLATGVEGLSVGGAIDYQDVQNTGSQAVFGLYTSFQATEKLSLHGRAEYYRSNNGLNYTGDEDRGEVWGLTLTAQYDLWQNVITRLEYRLDSANEPLFGDGVNAAGDSDPTLYNAHMIALNVIYVF